MNDAKATHPSAEQLVAYGQGRLSPLEQAGIERHIAECERCCQALRSVPNDTLLEQLRSPHTPSESRRPSPALKAPSADLSTGLPRELLEHSRYRIVKALGAGGMGVVYQAEHRLMERPVALKVINNELVRHPEAVARFRREVKAAARLTHPNIVTAHDAEQAGPVHFLVMEYVEGVSLAQLVHKRGPLPVAHACHYIRQAALGLQHAFEQGMVHRDIKPQNLMLTRKGQVKILDFGLARFARERDPNGPQQSSHGLTEVNTVLGTPDYMAPEQANDAHRADIRSDIYSLGCTLYYLLVGRVPFPEGSDIEKLIAHVEQPPPPLAGLRSDVPADLVQVVETMMAKAPAGRYQTPAEVAQALLPFAKSSRDTPTVLYTAAELGVQRRPFFQQQARSLLAAAAVLLVVVGVGGFLLPRAFHPTARSVVQVPPVKDQVPDEAKIVAVETKPASSKPQVTPNPPNPEPKPGPRPLRILYVIAPQNNRYVDYESVKKALQRPDIKLEVAALVLEPARMDPRDGNHPTVTPDLRLDRVRTGDMDAVIFGGGIGMAEEYMLGQYHPGAPLIVKHLIGEMLTANKPVAAIGKGVTGVLVDKGFLKGQEATGSDEGATRFMFAQNGVKWLNEPVVESGLILTVRDAEAIPEFTRTLLKKLGRGN